LLKALQSAVTDIENNGQISLDGALPVFAGHLRNIAQKGLQPQHRFALMDIHDQDPVPDCLRDVLPGVAVARDQSDDS
jgi:hypothetical protein